VERYKDSGEPAASIFREAEHHTPEDINLHIQWMFENWLNKLNYAFSVMALSLNMPISTFLGYFILLCVSHYFIMSHIVYHIL
jgi:hypothetical protein